jgi:hypothetical protein
MHRIEGADFVQIGGENFFTDGPPGTVVTASWLNAVQEEIANVIEDGGGTLQTAATETRDQLLTYLKVLFVEPAAVETLTNKTINSDSNTLTLDSTDANTTIVIDTSEALTSFILDTSDAGTTLTIDSADANTTLAIDTSNAGTSFTMDTADAGTDINIDSADANTVLVIDNAQANTTINSASTTVAGVVEKSTSAENIAGSSDTVYPSVLGLRQAFNASGSAPVFACRAWVNFDGTGVVAIAGSGNVTSIGDVAVGRWTVNFTTAIQDTNYAIVGTTTRNTTGAAQSAIVQMGLDAAKLTTSCDVQVRDAGGNLRDETQVNVCVFR